MINDAKLAAERWLFGAMININSSDSVKIRNSEETRVVVSAVFANSVPWRNSSIIFMPDYP